MICVSDIILHLYAISHDMVLDILWCLISYSNIIYDFIYTHDMIIVMTSYTISHHNIPGGSIRSGAAAALAPPARARRQLPRGGDDPALAETLSPDPLHLSDGHHPFPCRSATLRACRSAASQSLLRLPLSRCVLATGQM